MHTAVPWADYYIVVDVVVAVFVVLGVVVVLILTHRHDTMQSVIAGQAPTTLEWKKYLGSKTEAKTKKQAYAFRH